MAKLLQIITIWSLFFSQISLAVDFKLQSNFNIRSESGELMKVLATLPKGTVVRIPDKYFGSELKGKMKDEIALLNWLKRAGTLKKYETASGKPESHYFFPIEVVSSPDKSIKSGTKGEVAIQVLAKKKNGLELITVADSPLLEVKKTEDIVTPPQYCTNCKPKTTGQNLYDDIKEKLNSIFSDIEEGAQKKIEAKKYPDVFIDNFNKTCGMDFYTFLGKLKKEAAKNGIPTEILLGMMSQESEGKCDAVHKDKGKNGKVTYSVGLFQINTDSTDLKFSDLKDPLKNMKESIRILIDKYKKVNDKESPKNDLPVKMMNKDDIAKWKKALSAYNGGEGHVYQAYKDIMATNKKYGLKLDPQDWETRRTFFFRKYLEENSIAKFDNKYENKRSTDNSVANLVYVESILGMNGVSGSLVETWYPELKVQIEKDPTVDEDQKRREDERQARIEQEEKERQAELDRIAKETAEAEEMERLRMEKEKLEAEVESARLKKERLEAEAEAARLKKENDDREAARIKAEKEEATRREEARLKEEADRKRLQEEQEKAETEEEKRRIEEAIADFVLNTEKEEKIREAKYAKEREEYQKKQDEAFQKWQKEQQELDKIREEEERLAAIKRAEQEVIDLNNSGEDYLDNTFKKVNRTTVNGIARLEYNYRVRNKHTKYTQKCTIHIQSIYNQVSDEVSREIIVKPGESVLLKGDSHNPLSILPGTKNAFKNRTLKKPSRGHSIRFIEDCEFLPPDYK